MSRYTKFKLVECRTSLLFILLVFSVLQVALPRSVVDEIIDPNEEILRSLVNYTFRIYQNSDSFSDCSCSKLGCDKNATFPDGVCDQPLDFGSVVFPSFGDACLHNCTRRKIEMSQSTVWRSKGSAAADRQSRVEACWTQSLDTQFNATLHRNAEVTKWQYIGTPGGLLRIFPGIPQNDTTCTVDPYDPTLRPWYIAAISGRKNVVMVLDASDSMAHNGRLDRLKSAAKQALNALDNIDYVGIVVFGRDAKFLNENEDFSMLQLADQDARARLSNAIDKIETMGGTNFEAAFAKAYSLLHNSLRHSNVLLCNTAILFVTDGVPTVGERNEANLLSLIRNLDRNTLQSPASIFTYVLGEATRTVLPKKIACASRGFFVHVPDGEEFADSFTSKYAEFFSLLRESAQVINPVWVEPYEDAFGLGLVTTTSQPVYDEHSRVIGVIGIDVPVANLREAAENNDTAWEAIISNLASRADCSTLGKTSECGLNNLRSQLDVQLCQVSSGSTKVCNLVDITTTSAPETYFANRDPPGFCNETEEEARGNFKLCCDGVPLELANNSLTCPLDRGQFQTFAFSILQKAGGTSPACSAVLLLLSVAASTVFTQGWIS